MTDIAIQARDAQLADVSGVVAMVGTLAAYHGDEPSLTADTLERDAFGERPWITLIVADVDGELAGYAALCGLIQLQFGARGVDMHHLFVTEHFRGRGVGRALVEACKVKARELSCLYMAVGTHPDNQAAQAFYEAQAFERREGHGPRFGMRL